MEAMAIENDAIQLERQLRREERRKLEQNGGVPDEESYSDVDSEED